MSVIEFDLPQVASDKVKTLCDQGYTMTGVILTSVNRPRERATIDAFGHVQWWRVSDSGVMVVS